MTLYNGFNAVVEFLQWTKWLPMVSNIFRVDEMAARKLQRRCLSYLIVDPTHSFGQSEIRSQWHFDTISLLGNTFLKPWVSLVSVLWCCNLPQRKEGCTGKHTFLGSWIILLWCHLEEQTLLYIHCLRNIYIKRQIYNENELFWFLRKNNQSIK